MIIKSFLVIIFASIHITIFESGLVLSKSLKFTPANKNPVILIPGDGGSQMQARLNKPSVVHFFCSQKTNYWFPIWLNLELITPLTIACLVDNLRLQYDNKTHTTSNSPGVDTRIVDFGNTTTVEYLDSSQLSITSYFYPLVELLVKQGYKRGVSVRGAPFDFRKAANELGDYYRDLRELVEGTYFLNGNKKVTLVAHSMGTIVTLYFLNHMEQAWKDKFLARFVTLGAPWGGAAKTIRVMASGDDLGVFVVRTIEARIEQRTMPSTVWMLPSPKFWPRNENLVETAERNYTADDYQEFFQALKYPTGWLMRQDTENLVADLHAPGVEVHCLHGSEVRTPLKFKWAKGYFPDYQPSVVFGDGDGTVNLRSLIACGKWLGEQKQKVEHHIYPGAEHMAILSNNEVLKYIVELVTKS